MRETVAAVLDRPGRTVVTCANGAELVERLAEDGPFDLMITDVGMPWMSGLQAAIAARNAGLEMPIIVISGRADERIAAQVRALGDRAVLMRKPFGLGELEATVARMLPT